MNSFGNGEKLKINLKPILLDFEKLIGPSTEWNNLLTTSNWAEYTNKGNQIFRSSIFQNKYREILISAGMHMGLRDFFYQTYPTFRIQLPNAKSVSYHTDDISSGHAKNIVNFWFPLTELNENNCLWIVEEKESSKIIKQFKSNRLSLNNLDSIARKKAKPAVIGKNEMLCFSNRTLHGTVQNKSNDIRASIDFRCLPINEDPGTKILGVDYLKFSEPKKKLLKECVSVVFQSGYVKHIGHGAQRAVINDFALRNGFSIIRECSEWHTVDFYPEILNILENRSDMPILIFSKKSFDITSKAWQSLILNFKKHNANIYFCLENEIFKS